MTSQNSTRVVVFGYDQLVLSSLDVVTKAGDEVVAVVFPSSRHDDRVAAVRAQVEDRGYTVLEQPPRTEVDPFVRQLADLDPDIGLVWSYPMILPPSILEVPRLGCVNLHPAPLPEYRGTNVIQWTLINGESHTGMTLHQMDEGIDTGPILAQSKSAIGPEDDFLSLMKRSKSDGEMLLAQAWPRVTRGELEATPQDESSASYYQRLAPWDRRIDWTMSAVEITNLVRALVAPEWGAATELRGQQVVVRAARATGDATPLDAKPGQIVSVSADGLRVGTGDGVLLILGLQVYRTENTPEDFGVAVGDVFGH